MSLVASFAPSLRSGANDATRATNKQYSLQKSSYCPIWSRLTYCTVKPTPCCCVQWSRAASINCFKNTSFSKENVFMHTCKDISLSVDHFFNFRTVVSVNPRSNGLKWWWRMIIDAVFDSMNKLVIELSPHRIQLIKFHWSKHDTAPKKWSF